MSNGVLHRPPLGKNWDRPLPQLFACRFVGLLLSHLANEGDYTSRGVHMYRSSCL